MGLILKGGWVMVVLLGFSTTALAIIVQKIMLLKRTAIDRQYLPLLTNRLVNQSPDLVLKELRYSTQIADLIAAKTIECRQLSSDGLSAEMTQLIRQDVQSLSSKMNVLSMIITASPVMGLLGTVLGLMEVFSVISVEGVGKAALLSAGISKALITTVGGLSLAIPLMFVHQWLSDCINNRINEWDNIPSQVLLAINRQSTK